MKRPEAHSPGADPVISVRGLCFSYASDHVLHDVDLDVFENDFLAIIGPNGGGKTTLVKLILGLLEPERGHIERRIGLGKGGLGYVPQYATFDRSFPMRASEVVLMGRWGHRGLLRRYRAEDRAAAVAALDRVGLADLARRPISELSGGQVQRVLIARALAGEPELMILDEPTASVDPESREGLQQLLLELNTRMPIIIVTHDLSMLPEMVKNVACLNRELYYHPGAEVSDETLEQVYGCHVDLIAHGHPHRVLHEHPRAASGSDSALDSRMKRDHD